MAASLILFQSECQADRDPMFFPQASPATGRVYQAIPATVRPSFCGIFSGIVVAFFLVKRPEFLLLWTPPQMCEEYFTLSFVLGLKFIRTKVYWICRRNIALDEGLLLCFMRSVLDMNVFSRHELTKQMSSIMDLWHLMIIRVEKLFSRCILTFNSVLNPPRLS